MQLPEQTNDFKNLSILLAISDNKTMRERLEPNNRTLIASMSLATIPQLEEMERNLIILWAEQHYSTDKPTQEEIDQSRIAVKALSDDFEQIAESYGYHTDIRLIRFLRILGLCGCIEESWLYAKLSIAKLICEGNGQIGRITLSFFLSKVIRGNYVFTRQVVSAVGLLFQNQIQKHAQSCQNLKEATPTKKTKGHSA